MKIKMKMVIFFASVLFTVLAFNWIATYVYRDRVRIEKQTAPEVLAINLAKVEKRPSQNIVPYKKQ